MHPKPARSQPCAVQRLDKMSQRLYSIGPVIDHTYANQLAARRSIEDALLKLGRAHTENEAIAELNRTAIKSWLVPAREAGLTVSEIARLTAYTKQSLHAWMRQRMSPIPAVHLGLTGPRPESLEEAVLRTIGEDPKCNWTASPAREAIPTGWPTGSVGEVATALERLFRSGQIWKTDDGYQIAEPDPDAS